MGRLYPKCQATDYMLRGESLEDMNIIEYFVHTYEADMERRYLAADEDDNNDSDADEHRRPGRKRNERVLYLPNHPKYTRKLRILRSRGHNQLPNFIGRYFPRADDDDTREFYCACMLLLLKPWRDVRFDLKASSQSWTTAFDMFVSRAPQKAKDIMSGIQYFYESRTAAEEERERDDDVFVSQFESQHTEHTDNTEFELGEDVHVDDDTFTEEGLATLIASQLPLREELHGQFAVERAKYANIFTSDSSSWDLNQSSTPTVNATGDDLHNLLQWKTHLEADVNAQNSNLDSSRPEESGDSGDVIRLTDVPTDTSGQVSIIPPNETSESSLPAVNPSQLKPDQFRAYDIIAWHLDQTIAGKNPPPLRMIIYGEGGTGKSRVIQTVTENFAQRGTKYMLLKAAYTGVAASLIDGKTTHVIGMISTSGRPMSDETKTKLQQFWKYFIYLVIDEISMISKSFLAVLSRHIGIGKANSDTGKSFGGIHVILCGDFHQFPPVACAISEALYYPANMVTDSVDSQIGRAIYEEFDTVVILRDQLRVTDPVWRDFLTHLRYGHVQEHHLSMLQKQIVKNPACEPTDFGSKPWNDTPLVTPRHAVRIQWNEAAIRKHCQDTKGRLFVCPAEDRIKNRHLTLAERYGVAARNATCAMDGSARKKRKRKNELPDMVELAIGMKVMVTENVETDLDVTNGARGEIVGIVLHPDEPPLSDESVVILKHLPAYVLVKLGRTRATQLEGLDENVIPIEMATRTFQIKVRGNGGQYSTRTVRRRQFPMTAAYCFTDYRSQGQTIPYVIVDIATPPTGMLSLFNLYVALSRSSGRSSIRLLRDFDDGLFQKSHDTALMQEDDRLERQDISTKAWWKEMGRDKHYQATGNDT